MKSLLTALALLILVTVPAKAREITQIAPFDCGAWLENRKNQDVDMVSKSTAKMMTMWLVGFLNGASLVSGKEFWESGQGITGKKAFYWMDKYCR